MTAAAGQLELLGPFQVRCVGADAGMVLQSPAAVAAAWLVAHGWTRTRRGGWQCPRCSRARA